MSSADLVSEPDCDDEQEKKRKKKSENREKEVKSEEAISNFFGFQNKQQISAVKPGAGIQLGTISNENSVCSNMHNSD